MIRSVPLFPYDKDNGQPGILGPSSRGWTVGARTLTANRGYAARIFPSRDMLIAAVIFEVTTAAGTDDPCTVGIYDTVNRLALSATTSGKLNSLGVKNVPLATAVKLLAGHVYYVAFSVGTIGGTVPALSAAAWQSSSGMALFGATAGRSDAGVKDTSHPLPASLASFVWSGSTTNHPVLIASEV